MTQHVKDGFYKRKNGVKSRIKGAFGLTVILFLFIIREDVINAKWY